MTLVNGASGNLRMTSYETHTLNGTPSDVKIWAPHFKLDAMEVA
jgi:hypothetical protein